MAEEDSLALRRSRRSTAGNRMEVALAEMAALHPEADLDVDDDNEFLVPIDEEEVFDSDFQSTDEEEEQDDEATAEREVIAEEKQARKSVRRQALRAVESRSAPLDSSTRTSVRVDAAIRRRPKRRGADMLRLRGTDDAVDAETVETLVKRKSQRQSTMLSSQILHSRLKDAEERRALLPKRSKDTSVTYTQAELLARALDTEEGNIISHRNYLEDEEEKRRRARVVKRKLTGPVLSWISRLEDENGVIPPAPSTSRASFPSYTVTMDNSQVNVTTDVSPAPSTVLPALSQNQTQPQSNHPEKISKNYLLHRVDDGFPRPDWSETMTAVFGEHADWKEVKVYSGKHRPLSRPAQKCPITGWPAIYRDPRTGVSFAGVDAFRTLSRLLVHEYVWNDGLRCYTADEKAVQLEPEGDELMDDGPAPATHAA